MNEQAKTNADRIRAMTVEELSEKMSRIAKCWFCPVRCDTFCTDISIHAPRVGSDGYPGSAPLWRR